MNLRYLIWRHFVFAVLLAITLCFSEARETQSLCLRWMFHLKGNTFVQGQPPGCDIWLIPNAKFTPRFTVELQHRSARSLEDFARTTATRDWMSLQPPPINPNWTNSPLLPWMTFLMTLKALGDGPTNTISGTTLNAWLPLLRLAEEQEPANGAYYQAEAALEFAAQDNSAAVQSLFNSCSNGNWNAGSAGAFPGLTQLFAQAGLSRLDVALTFRPLNWSAFYLPSLNQARLEHLMVKAVANGNPREFQKLFALQVDLRRPEWTDTSSYGTAYRRYKPGNELIQAMAGQMQKPLPPGWPKRDDKDFRRQIFQDYLDRNVDPVTTARFNVQTDAYQTESKLRIQNYTRYVQVQNIWEFYNGVSGMLAFLLHSLLGTSIMFDLVIWKLNQQNHPAGKWPHELQFWLISLVAVITSSAMITNFWHALGAGVEVGFDVPQPDDRIETQVYFQPLWAAFLILVVFFSARLALLANKWRRGKFPVKPFLSTRFFAITFLISGLVMAYCRHQWVAVISSQYQ